MINRLFKILVILMLMGIITGCTNDANQLSTTPPDEIEKVKVQLYYSDLGNEQFVEEEREILFPKGQDKYSIVLQELIKGPENSDYRSNIASKTIVYGTMKQGNDLIVNLSKEFCSIGGSIAEIIAVGSVVNTLTSFDRDINRVKILVEGDELIGPSGNSRGFMEPFENNISQPEVSKEIALYFCNQDATALAQEKRIIAVAPDITMKDLMLRTLEELIKGPTDSDLHKTIPVEVQVNSVEIDDNIALVDFSIEMHSKHWGGTTGEGMTINSIVYTLTEFPGIDKVKMTVEGGPISIEHGPIDEAVGRH